MLIIALLLCILLLNIVLNQISTPRTYNYTIKPDRKRNHKYIDKEESQRKQKFAECEGLLYRLLRIKIRYLQKMKQQQETVKGLHYPALEKEIIERNKKIKDLQGTVKNLQKDLTTYHPPMQN